MKTPTNGSIWNLTDGLKFRVLHIYYLESFLQRFKEQTK